MSVHTVTCFRVLGLRREEPTTTAAATCRASRISNLAQQQQQAAEVAMVVVRTATPTPDLPQLRKLPRQARHRAGVSPPTIETALFLFGPVDALHAVCSFVFVFFRAGFVAWFRLPWYMFLQHICYANHIGVNIDRIRREALK